MLSSGTGFLGNEMFDLHWGRSVSEVAKGKALVRTDSFCMKSWRLGGGTGGGTPEGRSVGSSLRNVKRWGPPRSLWKHLLSFCSCYLLSILFFFKCGFSSWGGFSWCFLSLLGRDPTHCHGVVPQQVLCYLNVDDGSAFRKARFPGDGCLPHRVHPPLIHFL